MKRIKIQNKRLQIDKANQIMVVAVAIAAFLTVFSAIASHALFLQRGHQARVITAKEEARDQLEANLEARDQLVTAYRAFIETPENIIGGNPDGDGDRDGDNAKIILDALPSRYDFPALATSIDKLINLGSFVEIDISGKDDEVAQQDSDSTDPIEMPFEAEANVRNFAGVEDFFLLVERSIRPIKLQSLNIADEEPVVSIKAVTYFQPSKGVRIDKEMIE